MFSHHDSPLQTESLSLINPWVSTFVVSSLSYFVFHKYEPQGAVRLSSLVVLLPAALSLYNMSLHNKPNMVAMTFASYWSLLAFFAVVYRVSPFHPLAKYPGPFLNRISKIRMLQVALSGKLHHYHQQIHQRYGDIVRIGPNELSYYNVDGIQVVLGSPGLMKGPWYNHGSGSESSLVSIRDPSEYGSRRQLWNKTFSTAALKDYETHVIGRTHELIDGLSRSMTGSVDICEWMDFFGFDMMGDFTFGFNFNLLKTGKDTNGYRDTMISTMRLLAYFGQIPWMTVFLADFLEAGGPVRPLAAKIAANRRESGSTYRDLFHYLGGDDSQKSEHRSSQGRVVDEGVLAIIAGSDTTSTVLANLWYFLLRYPGCYKRLQAEVDQTFPSGEEPHDQHKLSTMPYLQACLNESMRLIPPVPSGSQRHIPIGGGGKMVGSHFLPEGTNIVIHTYSIQRDPRYFSPYPDSFWPDRWLAPENRKSLMDVNVPFNEEDKVVLNTAAFIPFSVGTRSCPGKNLAMMEMRVVACHIVQRFDMQPEPGYDLNDWEHDLEDVFVFKKGDLHVVLTER